MKKIFSAALAVIMLLNFSACSIFAGNSGAVYVTAGGERYATVENSVKENGRLTALEFKEQIEQIIPYSGGLTINLDGDHSGDVLYSLYDGQCNEFYSGKTALEIPVAVGTYYCIVEVNWGDGNSSQTCQYAFCFARSE